VGRCLGSLAATLGLGVVCSPGPLPSAAPVDNDVNGMWVRGRLADVIERAEDTEIDTIRARVEVVGEGVVPDRALANLDNNAFLFLDLGKNAFVFGKEPKVDCVLYLACDDLLRTPDAEILIEMVMADTAAVAKPNPSEDLILAWDYFDGKRWRTLGARARAAACQAPRIGFHDSTRGSPRPARSASAARATWRRSTSTARSCTGCACASRRWDYGLSGTTP
jgi:hypothetical protein